MSKDEAGILLVEDDPYDLDLTMRALQAELAGSRIEVARDGEEALDFLFCRGAISRPDPDQFPKLILLDLKLPKVDGLEVLRQVRQDPRTRYIPVVILTSSRQDSDMLRAYELGTNGYVQKPVDFDVFREAIKHLGYYWLRSNEAPPRDAGVARSLAR